MTHLEFILKMRKEYEDLKDIAVSVQDTQNKEKEHNLTVDKEIGKIEYLYGNPLKYKKIVYRKTTDKISVSFHVPVGRLDIIKFFNKQFSESIVPLDLQELLKVTNVTKSEVSFSGKAEGLTSFHFGIYDLKNQVNVRQTKY